MSLNLEDLRYANTKRCRKWDVNGSHTIEFATIELAGEVGEVCNNVKKYLRATSGMVGGLVDCGNLADELADVIICVDLLAAKFDIDLSKAVVAKFNKTSVKHGFQELLAERIGS